MSQQFRRFFSAGKQQDQVSTLHPRKPSSERRSLWPRGPHRTTISQLQRKLDDQLFAETLGFQGAQQCWSAETKQAPSAWQAQVSRTSTRDSSSSTDSLSSCVYQENAQSLQPSSSLTAAQEDFQRLLQDFELAQSRVANETMMMGKFMFKLDGNVESFRSPCVKLIKECTHYSVELANKLHAMNKQITSSDAASQNSHSEFSKETYKRTGSVPRSGQFTSHSIKTGDAQVRGRVTAASEPQSSCSELSSETCKRAESVPLSSPPKKASARSRRRATIASEPQQNQTMPSLERFCEQSVGSRHQQHTCVTPRCSEGAARYKFNPDFQAQTVPMRTTLQTQGTSLPNLPLIQDDEGSTDTNYQSDLSN